LIRGSRDAGLQDEDSHTGKTDEEEDRGRIRYDGGGGGSYVEEILGPEVAERLRRGDIYWQSPGLGQLTSSVLSPTTVVTAVISYLPIQTVTLPVATSQLQLSDLSTTQTTTLTIPTSAPLSTGKTVEFTLDTRITPTIVSTISSFAPNRTSGKVASALAARLQVSKNRFVHMLTNEPAGDLSRVPITTGGTVIIFTTPAVRNRTTLMSTLSKSTMTRKMTTRTSTILSTTVNSTTILTDYPRNDPQPTAGGNTPLIPATPKNSDVASNDSSNSSAPQVEPRLVGGIVGGVAGLALIVFALFLLLKRHKRQRQIQALDDAGYGGPLAGGPSMVQRSISFLGGGLTGGGRGGALSSDPTDVDPAERGFVKISGKKLPPVIGGPRPELGSMRSNTQSSYYTGDGSGVGASMSRPSRGPSRYSTGAVQTANPFASPPSSPTGPGPGIGLSPRLQEHVDTDSIEEIRAPPKPPPPRPLFNRQLSLGTDDVGRSHPSHDGSRGSRFTEDIT